MAGGGSFYTDDDAAITEINVTPLVDVMLVMLVIFIVTARLIATRGVDVAVPDGPGNTQQQTIEVAVDKNGVLEIDEVVYENPIAAVAKLKELTAGQKEPKVVIKGDKEAAYDGVMRAITIVKTAGIERIALATAPMSELLTQ
jgi:biopolymer transport protein ExbD